MKIARLLPVSALLAAASFTVPAMAVTTVYNVMMNGASESPPNASTAIGLGLVTFDDVALTMLVNELYIGLTGGAPTGAHIHCCTAAPFTGTAPVVVDFISAGFPTTTSGNYDHTFVLTAGTFATLSAGAAAGKAYLNIHNATYGGGEIRGFLVAVPEPATYAMLVGGLAAVGFMARRRRQS